MVRSSVRPHNARVENGQKGEEFLPCTTRIKKKRRIFLFADKTDLKSIKKNLLRE